MPECFRRARRRLSVRACLSTNRIFVYKVTNYASLPSFSFQYLSDGKFFQHLDGTEEPIHAVNDKSGLNLDKNNVIEYLKFYFSHVGDEDGDITIITNPHDMPLLDSLDQEAYNAVFNDHKPPEIHYDGGFDTYQIEANLYKDTQLVRAKITVTTKGRVEIKEQKMIMHQMLDSGSTQVIL